MSDSISRQEFAKDTNVLAKDLISRQDAIDTIRKFQTYKLFEKDNMLLVDQAEVMTELMMLPSAEPQWIPVGERLPDLKTEVIYSFDGIVSTGYMTDRDYEGEKTESHWEDLESGVTIEPIAWMPLPPPYEGGETV